MFKVKTPERRQFFSFSIVDFEQVNVYQVLNIWVQFFSSHLATSKKNL